MRTLVEVGGGHRALLSLILDRAPNLKGILFDRLEVTQSAGEVLQAGGHAGEVQCIAGDFFEGVPAAADAYIMKHIIHDWDDENTASDCSRIVAGRWRLGGVC